MWSLLAMTWERQCWHSRAVAKYEGRHLSRLEKKFNRDFCLLVVHAFEATERDEGG